MLYVGAPTLVMATADPRINRPAMNCPSVCAVPRIAVAIRTRRLPDKLQVNHC
jgi:hypothetical protein